MISDESIRCRFQENLILTQGSSCIAENALSLKKVKQNKLEYSYLDDY